MKRVLLAVLPLVLSVPLAAQKPAPNTIYGDDGRLDLYQVKDARVRKLAESTVALFESYDVALDTAAGQAVLATRPYGSGENLCKDEPFWDQKNGAFCSGSLVAPDIIMTAGHCVTDADSCASTKFVFGFGIENKGDVPDAVPAGEVYGCKELLGRLQEGKGADWALVRLDRAAANHEPLALDRGDGVANGTPVFVIGHPAGLPTKVAGGAKVRDASPNGYFVTNLDTYGGNSGSAVFGAGTGLVEGILVRGEQDFVRRGACRVSKRCPDDGCRGEDVTKISALMSKIPDASGGQAHAAPLPSLKTLAAFIKASEDRLKNASFDSN